MLHRYLQAYNLILFKFNVYLKVFHNLLYTSKVIILVDDTQVYDMLHFTN